MAYEYENGTADYTKVLDHIFSVDDGKCTVCHLQKAISVTIGNIPYFFDSFSDAIAKAEEGTSLEPATIKLYTDITVAEAVTMTGGVATLDLNGKTVSFTTQGGTCLTLDGVSLTICDTSAANIGTLVFDMTGYLYSYGGITLDNASTLTLESGTLTANPGYPLMLLGDSTVIQNGGTMNNGVFINSGKYILNDGSVAVPFLNTSKAADDDWYIELEIYGGTLSVNAGKLVDDLGDLIPSINATISGGIFSGSYPLYVIPTGEITLSGGTFEGGLKLDEVFEVTLADVLAAGYAFYDADGNLISLTEGQTEITGKVTVGVCTHSFVYTANGNVITETCANLACSHSATATIGMEDTVPYYNGTAHYVPVTYSDGWVGGELVVSYSGTAYDGSDYAVTGPISVGGVDASISISGATAEFGYSIQPSYVDVGTVFVESPTTVYNTIDIADIVLGRTNTTVPGTLTFDAGQPLHSNITTYNWTFTPTDKSRNMSQEELGEKMFVSRQTVSQWETGQTTPSIESLVKLHEIFEVSVDELLGLSPDKVPEDQSIEAAPAENHCFQFEAQEVKQVLSHTQQPLVKALVICSLLAVLCFISLIAAGSAALSGVMCGIFVGYVIVYIRSLVAGRRAIKSAMELIPKREYSYSIAEGMLKITVTKDGALTTEDRRPLEDISSITLVDGYYVLVVAGRSYIIRTADLKSDSKLLLYLRSNTAVKTVPSAKVSKWRTWSMIVMIASFASIFGGLILSGGLAVAAGQNGEFTRYMWTLFLFLPIPICSILLGYRMKRMGMKYKKNVVVGCIMCALLCIYGCFTFIFSGMNSAIDTIRDQMGIEIPSYKSYEMSSSFDPKDRERMASLSACQMIFTPENTEVFYTSLGEQWLTELPGELESAVAVDKEDYEAEYCLLYNIQTKEYNTAPAEGGEYDMILLLFSKSEGRLYIFQYRLNT